MVIGRRSLLLAGLALPASAYGQCVTDRFAEDACRGGVRNTAAALPPGASLDLSFMTPGTLDPLLTFARASTATYFDATGTMQTAAINAPRWEPRGLLLEDTSTNGVRNSTMAGAVVAGAVPTNWVVTGVTGITVAVAGLGTENGLSYIDFSFSGTVGTSGNVTVAADSSTQIAAVTGQAWAATCYLKLVSGSVVGTLSSGYSIRGAGGAALGDYLAPITPSTASLATQRWLQTNTSGVAGIAFVQPKPVVLALTNGQVVNFTLRVAGPQLEQKDTPSSYIPTSSVAVTRAIDSCLISPANMSPWFTAPGGSWLIEFDYLDATPINNARIIARADLVAGVSPALITSVNLAGQTDGVAVNSANAATANAITKAATTWAAGQAKVCVNGGAVASSALLATGYGALVSGGIRLLSVGSGLSCEGHIRRVTYWPRVLADAEMQQVTT